MKEYTIDQYRDAMMDTAQKTLPKKSKQILATETQKLKRYLLKYAEQNVPVSEIDESGRRKRKGQDASASNTVGGEIVHKKYHASFKVGKTYKYNESLSKRAFNNSRHGRYVEGGRKIVVGYKRGERYGNLPNVIGRTKAYRVYGTVKPEFAPVYKQDLLNWIDKITREGKL